MGTTSDAATPASMVTFCVTSAASFSSVTVCSPGASSTIVIGVFPSGVPSMLMRAPAGSVRTLSCPSCEAAFGISTWCDICAPAVTVSGIVRDSPSSPRTMIVCSPAGSDRLMGVFPARLAIDLNLGARRVRVDGYRAGHHRGRRGRKPACREHSGCRDDREDDAGRNPFELAEIPFAGMSMSSVARPRQSHRMSREPEPGSPPQSAAPRAPGWPTMRRSRSRTSSAFPSPASASTAPPERTDAGCSAAGRTRAHGRPP